METGLHARRTLFPPLPKESFPPLRSVSVPLTFRALPLF